MWESSYPMRGKGGSRIINTAISLLPNFILAAVIFVLFLSSPRPPNPLSSVSASGSSVVKASDCYSVSSHK
jgi:hypothetical protein